MSMWCGFPGCNRRLWPSEHSGAPTYRGETRPVVERDAAGKVTRVRCVPHAHVQPSIQQLKDAGCCVDCHRRLEFKSPQCEPHEVRAGRFTVTKREV